MKRILKKGLAAIFAVLCIANAGAYEEPVYTVTVAAGTNNLDEATVEVTQNGETTTAAFSSLTLDQGGTFVKKGMGWLQSSTAMSVFTGEVVVAEGALILTEDGQAGATLNNVKYRVTTWTNCASLVVSNGATVALITSAESTWAHLVQPVKLSGDGLNGLGAIYHYSVSKEDKGTQLYYSHVTLLGDTKFGYENSGRVGMGYCVVDMNGHDLTCVTFGSSCCNQVLCGLQVKNPGNIIADHAQLYFSDNELWDGTAANTVTFTNNAYFRMYNFGGTNNWTFVNTVPSLGSYASGNSKLTYALAPDNNIWHGPWRLDEDMIIGSNSKSQDPYGMTVAGAISGDGGLTVRHGWFRILSTENTFKGGVTVTTSGNLVLHGNGSLPADGGPLKVLNGGEVHFETTNEFSTLDYPAIDWMLAEGETNTLPATATNTVIASLVKRGEGVFCLDDALSTSGDYSAVFTVTGVTEIAGGTLRLPCARSGFVSGWFNSTDIGTGSNSDAVGNLDYMATNNIVRRTELAYTSTKAAWRRSEDPVYKGVIAYHGYVWNRSAEDKTVVFAQAMWKGSRLMIDGKRITGYDKPFSTASAVSFSHSSDVRVSFYTVTLTPGPHRIDLRTYTTSDWGPWGISASSTAQTNAVWKKNFGWAVNWNGTDSTNHVDFSEIVDPGDGSVFSVTTNGVDETIAALRTSFAHLKFTGGTLDLYGSDLYVPVLECGGGSITNSNEYQTNCTITVTDSIRVDGASYKGGTMKIQGKLRFAAGATLDCEDLSLLTRGDYSLVTATDGIEGMPAFDGNAVGNKGWHLGKATVDGVETLAFGWHLGTMFIVR